MTILLNIESDQTTTERILNFHISSFVLMAYPAIISYVEINKLESSLKEKLIESKGFQLMIDREEVGD